MGGVQEEGDAATVSCYGPALLMRRRLLFLVLSLGMACFAVVPVAVAGSPAEGTVAAEASRAAPAVAGSSRRAVGPDEGRPTYLYRQIGLAVGVMVLTALALRHLIRSSTADR
jgi:hypothetical protein